MQLNVFKIFKVDFLIWYTVQMNLLQTVNNVLSGKNLQNQQGINSLYPPLYMGSMNMVSFVKLGPFKVQTATLDNFIIPQITKADRLVFFPLVGKCCAAAHLRQSENNLVY